MQLEVLRHCVAMATAGQEKSGGNQESEESFSEEMPGAGGVHHPQPPVT